MKQPIRKRCNLKTSKVRKAASGSRKGVPRKHQAYGTSKLEEDFAREFLDKIGLKYIYQFEAKSIGRYYDFAVFINGDINDYSIGNIMLIEVDGGYYHSDPRLVDESKLSPMQKKNKRVDAYKNKWALEHGIPILRIWEKDIRENPSEVMKTLKERFYIQDKKQTIKENKNKRHVNKIK